MTEKLTRRGLRVPSDYHADILRTTEVGAVMTTPAETVGRDTAVGEIARRFRGHSHGAYPVVDETAVASASSAAATCSCRRRRVE